MISQRVALVTGASRGLGRAVAIAFAKKGYAIGVNYRSNDTEARATGEAVGKTGAPAVLLKGDVSSSKDVAAMMKMVADKWGRLDVLVNNAGATKNQLISKMTDEEWREVVSVNLDGTFYCTRAAISLMRERREGCIINVASFLAAREVRGAANYSASKAAVVSLTRSTALEEGTYNIRANAVMPGFHVTDMNQDVWKRFEENIRAQHLLKELPSREALADFVVEIAHLRTVTGQVFPYESRLV